MRILGLDLATSVGFAVGDPENGEPRFGTHRLPSTGDDIGRFLHAFDYVLSDIITLENPTNVVFEAPILATRTTISTARKLMCLAGHTELVCLRRSISCRECHLQTVKKFFTGSGRADKAAMIEAAKRHGWLVEDDNAADALAVWALAVHSVSPGAGRRFQAGQLGAMA